MKLKLQKKSAKVAKVAASTKPAEKPVKAKGPVSVTYRNSEAVRKAGLFNCRKLDITEGGSGIKAGSIVVGTHGLCVASVDVPGVTAKSVPFKRNASITMGKETYPGMVVGNPAVNYAVVRTPKGLLTAEIDRFAGQNSKARATVSKYL